jgi:hypothetical protein
VTYEYRLKVDTGSGPSYVRSPMMVVYRVFLIDIEFKELVVRITSIVLETIDQLSPTYTLRDKTYVFSFLKLLLTIQSSLTSINPSLTCTKYRLLSNGP